ncbi:uncharacterized protein [Chelonus insularis]|uniref:uncharacterized protein n=1 Tax=Chelonus insularis TaxID=460826 RepID=UPI0015896D31|nr:uncharacterized protein LOC118065729 [Chelonus insularis]
MNNINEVISNLYEALVLIRYPGIAQVDISNLESTVAKNNRIPMLHWLASHSLSIGDPNSNPPSDDETSIVQWYTELGVCTNREALLGECSLKDQLDTLVRLTHFVMNGFDQSQEPLDSPWDIAIKYCNSSTNIIPAASKYTGNLKYKAVEEFMERVEQNIKEARNGSEELSVKR